MTVHCSCDAFCDDPCPVHARENALQDEVIALRNALDALTAEHKALVAAHTHTCVECGHDLSELCDWCDESE